MSQSAKVSARGLQGEAVRLQLPIVEGPIVGDYAAPPGAMPTARQLEALHKQAYDEGFALGRADGREMALARGKAEFGSRIQRLEAILRELAQPLAELDDAVVESVAELAVLIARHVVRRELKANPGEVVGVVRETMRQLPVATRAARIRLHPEDAELVKEALGLDADGEVWRLEPDPLITRGGCVVETESSRIDAAVESRLAAIASRMLGGEREGDRGR